MQASPLQDLRSQPGVVGGGGEKQDALFVIGNRSLRVAQD
jgi:hypothetical protein